MALLREGRLEALAGALMAGHYDPAYRRARARHPVPVLATVEAGALSDADLDRAAARIAEAVAGA